MVSGFFTSPCDQPRIFSGEASLMRIASNVMGFACRSRMPHRSLVGLSSLIRLRSEEHTSELQSPCNLVCRLLLEKKKKKILHLIIQSMLMKQTNSCHTKCRVRKPE